MAPVTAIVRAAATLGARPAARVVYDLDREGFSEWPFLLALCGLALLSVAFIIYDRRRPRAGLQGAYRRVFLYAFALMAWTIAIPGVLDMLSAYRTNVRALREGQYERVEGIVQHFVPAPAGGHRDETFDVAGHHYAYSDFVVVPGYHRSQSHGGVVREGARVRIADLNGTILRLELLQ